MPLLAGQIITADALTPGWTPFTPSLSATTTNPTLGTGSTAEGEYRSDGSLITVRFRFVFGSSMNAGSGAYRISLPVSAHADWVPVSGALTSVGQCRIRDESVTTDYLAFVRLHSTTLLAMEIPGTGSVTSGVPFVWAASDSIHGVVQYRPAA